ncbi:hypothetical protein VVCECT4999_16070 [Vibrio vulnificus]|nr:hypothetical protein VVCECT4999_16070 [Vibrio vulnificus]KGK70917.1 hypothetical protein NA76_08085 [Vibrio vulnificus]PNG78111.1 hypothetical protein TI31_00355 [Vibrio vulnificus]POB74468.1 hypothetical protein CRN62_05215 [Vibrio vulnificus]POB76588.1 hypothetical protein CRN35_19820 [Vibrio vulnificus]
MVTILIFYIHRAKFKRNCIHNGYLHSHLQNAFAKCKMQNAKIILARVNIWDIQPKNSAFKVGMINA